MFVSFSASTAEMSGAMWRRLTNPIQLCAGAYMIVEFLEHSESKHVSFAR